MIQLPKENAKLKVATSSTSTFYAKASRCLVGREEENSGGDG